MYTYTHLIVLLFIYFCGTGETARASWTWTMADIQQFEKLNLSQRIALFQSALPQ